MSNEDLEQKIRTVLEGAAGLDLSQSDVIDRYLQKLSPAIKNTIGGETSCLEIIAKDQHLILDAGSGLRNLGRSLLERGFAAGSDHAHFLMTHTHWDHIQGFPFFRPAFVPKNSFTFYSNLPDLEARFRGQQSPVWFPISLDYMAAQFDFKTIYFEVPFQIGHLTITPIEMAHPGGCCAYRIDDGERVFVYATDAAYENLDVPSNERYIEFFQDADLLVFDAHFSFTESVDKPDWGHSTAMVGAEFAYRANVKRLALFHHAPESNDPTIYDIMKQAQAYLDRREDTACEVIIASDGLELDL